MKISVLTPALNTKGLKIVANSLKQQQFTDWEWIICCPEQPIELGLPEEKDIIWLLDEFKGGFWTLNRAYNWMFQEARGELLVSWQDYIKVRPDGLQKFWDSYRAHPNDLFTGVGDQYELLANVDDFTDPTIVRKVWVDPRRTDKYGSFYECIWRDCEWNWAAIPKSALKIGGMDSVLDLLGYGGDQYQFCERFNDADGHFWIDQTNESFTQRQTRRKDWDKHHILFNGAYDKRKEQLKKEGQWPTLK
jgi:hypothetical protein